MQSTASNLGAKDLSSCLHALCPVLERYAVQRFGSLVLTAGWQDFGRWGAAAIAHEKETYQSVFSAWWLFAWLPDDHGVQDKTFLAPPPDHAIAADYLASHRSRLSLVEQRIIERALKSPFSFYKIMSVESGNRLRLQEVYTKKLVMVETDASISCAAGDVLFCAVISIDNVSTLLGCMPQALSSGSLIRIETHREKWREEVGAAIDERLLYLHDSELRRFYFVLLNQVQQAKLH